MKNVYEEYECSHWWNTIKLLKYTSGLCDNMYSNRRVQKSTLISFIYFGFAIE